MKLLTAVLCLGLQSCYLARYQRSYAVTWSDREGHEITASATLKPPVPK